MNRNESKWVERGWTIGWWDLLTKGERQQKLAELSDREVDEFFYDWRVWGRDDQLAPDWDWDTWLMLAGRGWGKTRTAVEFILDKVNSNTGEPLRIAIVGQGEDDVRLVMVEGESGFINCAPPWNKPKFYPSKGGGVLVWPNGCQAFIYSIADTEALRGPQFHYGWCDEPMAAPRALRERALDNLEFCLRLGAHPQLLITTTPKPDPWLRGMEREAKDPANKIAITRGTTYDNAKNLAANFLTKITRKYGGTKKGRQEIEGKILGDEEGALWTEDGLDERRVPDADIHEFAASCDKLVVSVDPNTKNSDQKKARKIAHAAGIVVCGKKGAKRYVLADRTTKGGPNKWVPAVVDAVIEFDADEIVVEVNQGGDMAKMLLQQELAARGMSLHIHTNFAKKSKEGRAEPVSRMYDRGEVLHVGAAAEYETLEMQMCYLHEDEDPTGEDFDRCDALVWGITRLGLKKRASSGKSSGVSGIRTMGDFNGASDSGGF